MNPRDRPNAHFSADMAAAATCGFIIVSFQAERQRSPDGAPCATYGATHCWNSLYLDCA